MSWNTCRWDTLRFNATTCGPLERKLCESTKVTLPSPPAPGFTFPGFPAGFPNVPQAGVPGAPAVWRPNDPC